MAKTNLPKFKPGAKVSHPRDPDGEFEAGTGTVMSVKPGKGQTLPTYRLKCDTTGEVLDCDFPEADLTAAD